MSEAYIVSAARTAGGRRKGALAGWHPVELAAEVLNATLDRTGIGTQAPGVADRRGSMRPLDDAGIGTDAHVGAAVIGAGDASARGNNPRQRSSTAGFGFHDALRWLLRSLGSVFRSGL